MNRSVNGTMITVQDRITKRKKTIQLISLVESPIIEKNITILISTPILKIILADKECIRFCLYVQGVSE